MTAPPIGVASDSTATSPPTHPSTAMETTTTTTIETTINTDDFPPPASQRPKLSGWQFYEQILGSPQLVVAPMVDQSELAWRLLSRRHGAQLCYTPMFHANIFTQDVKYRAQALQSCAADRPLIVQFCGNDAQTLLEAAFLAQDHCDAIDINLGCPQAIAKRGHYGAYLQDEWDLLADIVRTLHERLAVPVTCKIRIFEDREKTVRYAQMLERAGCQLLTVHGRTRDQKGPLTGVADWSYIREVRANVTVPMFANGNIMCMADVRRCLAETGVQGVMTAEGNLHNPGLFDDAADGRPVVAWEIAEEYLDLVDQYPCPTSYVRGHLFKVFHHLLNQADCVAERERIAVGHTHVEFRDVVRSLRAKYQPIHDGLVPFVPAEDAVGTYDMSLPPWLCQPYVRLEPDVHRRLLAEKEQLAVEPGRERTVYRDEEGNEISRKLAKRLKRAVRRPNYQRNMLVRRRERDRAVELCSSAQKCGNPAGLRCEHAMCRVCCKDKCYRSKLQCVGHKFCLTKKRTLAEGADVVERIVERPTDDVFATNIDE